MTFPFKITARAWKRNEFLKAWVVGTNFRRGPNDHDYSVVIHEDGVDETNASTRDVDGFADPQREGRMWCHGWEGPQVDALKTVEALSEAPSRFDLPKDWLMSTYAARLGK